MVVAEMLWTVDLVEKDIETLVFWTCDEETSPVVFQIGTSDSFSIIGENGAALLSKPNLIHDILTTLERSLNIPVTCKIRLLKTHHDTVELAGWIEKTGVAAKAVHGRKVADRPRGPTQWDGVAEVVSALSILVIANGDVFEYSNLQCIKDARTVMSLQTPQI
ncbi:unnamed protein product [Sphagnum jensenii]